MSATPNPIAYKESGIPWVGKIPEHWEMRRVKHLFEIGRGRVISQEELDDNGLYPVYSSQTQDNGILGYIQTYDFDCEQITWTTDGVNAGTVFLRRGKHNCTNVCGTLRPKNKNENIVFLTFALQNATPYYKRPDTNGAKIMNNEMAEILLIYPPLKEQQAIADFLDKKTRQIEEFIDKKQKLITLLEEKKQTLINQCVTQGLDTSTPLKDSGVEWLGKIPTHWEVRKLKYVVSLRNQKEGESDFRIGLENIESKTGRFIQADESAFDDEGIGFFEGDVLFGKLRPYLAKVFLADKNGICVSEFLVLKSEGIFNRFLKFLMLSGVFIEVVNSSTYGTKMPRANWEFIGNLKIPIPPLEEQKAIAEYLDTQIEKIDLTICKIKSQINLIKEYKTTLISEAVCGRVEGI